MGRMGLKRLLVAFLATMGLTVAAWAKDKIVDRFLSRT